MNLLLKLFCGTCLLVSCTRKQPIKYLTDLDQANIKGAVAKLVTETYRVNSLTQFEKLESINIEIFNTLGYTVTDTAKNFIEENEVVNFLTYNENGSLSSLSNYENGKKQSEMLLKYDDGKCISIKNYNAKGVVENYYDNIKQNKFGLLLSLSSYNIDGKLIMSYVNDYDSIYQISATQKDSIGALTSEVKIQLTDKKYQESVAEVTYFKDSTVKNYLSYKYENWDKKGNWVKQTIFNVKGSPIKMVKRIFSYYH